MRRRSGCWRPTETKYAFQFIRQKISDIEITPAQLALDPCSAGCVVTGCEDGEVRALVTYPSADNNKFSGYSGCGIL